MKRPVLILCLAAAVAGCAGDGPQGAEGPAGEPGQPGVSGAPRMISASALSYFSLDTDNLWHDVPSLTLTTPDFAGDTPCDVSWNASFPGSLVVTRLAIDGEDVPGSRIASGASGGYVQSSAILRTVLPAGVHTIALQYRTASGGTFDPTTDFESARIDLLWW